MRQVGKSYGGGKVVTEEERFRTYVLQLRKHGHIAAEYYSKSPGQGGYNKGGKEKVRQVYGEKDWKRPMAELEQRTGKPSEATAVSFTR